MLFIGLTFFPKVIYIIYLGVLAFMLMSTAATVTVRACIGLNFFVSTSKHVFTHLLILWSDSLALPLRRYQTCTSLFLLG